MATPPEGIAALRASFDAIDTALLRLVAERREVSRQMAALKEEHGLAFHDAARESELLARLCAEGRAAGIPGDLVERLFRMLLADSLAVQEGERQPPTGPCGERP